MKIKLFLIALTITVLTCNTFAGLKTSENQTGGDHPDMAWWQEARFGMFIHWGVYSIPGRGEWLMYQEHVPIPDYAKLADRFNPHDFNPKEWVAKAKEAGMKYVILTTRHHDGFCLFDSKVSGFTSV